MDKRLIIMRGVPGSGKSTFVRASFPDAVVCSADYYFTEEDGSYHFNGAELPKAHEWCQSMCREFMRRSAPVVVVDNCNVTIQALCPYLELAAVYGYQIEMVRLDTPTELAVCRGVHNVPENIVWANANRFQDWPGEQRIRVSGLGEALYG